jgi:hypothetical protein
MLTLNFAKRGSHGPVEARILEALQQIPLQHLNASFRSVRPAVVRDESMKRRNLVQPDTLPDYPMRGNPAQEECDTWTQSYADQHPRRCKASLVGSDQRTAQEPFGRLALLQLDGNCSGAVGHDADRRTSLRRDNPEASDKGPQRIGGFVESDLRAPNESAADAHPCRDRAATRTDKAEHIRLQGLTCRVEQNASAGSRSDAILNSAAR